MGGNLERNLVYSHPLPPSFSSVLRPQQDFGCKWFTWHGMWENLFLKYIQIDFNVDCFASLLLVFSTSLSVWASILLWVVCLGEGRVTCLLNSAVIYSSVWRKWQGPMILHHTSSSLYLLWVYFLFHFSSYCFLGQNLGVCLILPLSAGYPCRWNESYFNCIIFLKSSVLNFKVLGDGIMIYYTVLSSELLHILTFLDEQWWGQGQ